jgi:hypothetical protein
MEQWLAGVASTVLLDGARFLYQQAGEILSAWRARGRDPSAPPPQALPPPDGVQVPNPQPIADPSDDGIVDLLQELKDLVEPIKEGSVDPESAEARESLHELRRLLQGILNTSISLAGEPSGAVVVEDVSVVAGNVAGKVTGLRARLSSVTGGLQARNVRVQAADVEKGGEVEGVSLG